MAKNSISIKRTLLISASIALSSLQPPTSADTTIPSSNVTVLLQNINAQERSFILPFSSNISTNQGDGINANESKNWLLMVQGVVDAAGNGVSLSSTNGSFIVENTGRINSRGTGAAQAGVVLLSAGSIINDSGATITSSSNGIYTAVSGIKISNNGNAAIRAPTAINLNSSNNIIQNEGEITGSGGTAILLNGSGNLIRLNANTLIKGDIASNGSSNTLLLPGFGTITGSIAGNTGFETITASGQRWDVAGNVLLSGVPNSNFTIKSGTLTLSNGTISSQNPQNSAFIINPLADARIGNGGTTGQINIPVVNNGELTFYRSDSNLTINTTLSGKGVLTFEGTGVTGQSAYTLNSNKNTFTGNIVVAPGARLRLTTADPTPDAHIFIQNGGSLWLGGSAN